MKIIGITGPTGAGKTTALRALAGLGAAVIDADQVYHHLTETSLPLRRALENRFGPVYGPEGHLERKRLGAVVFQDQNALADLNQITHRFVGEEVDRLLDQARREKRPAAAIDAIGLIESGLSGRCDSVVAILAPEEVRVGRIMAREGISEEYARLRVKAQKEETFFRANCDYTLENDGSEPQATFEARARRLFQTILKTD